MISTLTRDDLHTLPFEARTALVQPLIDFGNAIPQRTEWAHVVTSQDPIDGVSAALRNARAILGLRVSDGTDLPRGVGGGRTWLGYAGDVHPLLTDLHRAVLAGEWLIEQPTPVLTPSGDDKARDAQARALMTMRRREQIALERRDRDAARISDLERRLSETATPTAPAYRPPFNNYFVDRQAWEDFSREAAQAANDQNKCSEYDDIAEAVDLMRRDDMTRVVTVNLSFSVEVSVPFTAGARHFDGIDQDTIDEAVIQYVHSELSSSDYSIDS